MCENASSSRVLNWLILNESGPGFVCAKTSCFWNRKTLVRAGRPLSNCRVCEDPW
jgi:hypothetical protein